MIVEKGADNNNYLFNETFCLGKQKNKIGSSEMKNLKNSRTRTIQDIQGI
jgi:hypothetical protein